MQNLINCIDSFTRFRAENKILMLNKGHNCVVNLRKRMCTYSNLDPVNVTEYAKFGLILSIHFQDIERKQTRNDRIMDNLKTEYTTLAVI